MTNIFHVRNLRAPPLGHPPGEHYILEFDQSVVIGDDDLFGPIKFYRTPHGGEVATDSRGKRILPSEEYELFEVVKDEVDAYEAEH
jgi:hypothetical protein